MKKRKRVDQIELDEKEIIRLYSEEELTIEDIRKKFGVNYATIKLRLVRNNVFLRNISESKKIVMNRQKVKEKTRKSSKLSSRQRLETNIKKYGTEVPSNNPCKREKWEQEYLNKHGIEWNKDPKRSEKIKNTCLEKYGVDNVSKTQESRKKISKNRWKNKTEEELKEIQNKSNDTFFKNNSLHKVKDILSYCDLELIDEFKGMTKKHKYKCKKCSNVFELVFNTIKLGEKCQICYPKNSERVSKLEKEVVEFLKEVIKTEIITNSNQIIPPQELDIYIPDLNIAIEFDGLWFHSDQGPNQITPNYHLNKTINCEKKNIRLIHIFEDEWVINHKKEIVKKRLKQILKISNSIKINARECIVKEITPSEKNWFLEHFHLQGLDISSVKLGAFYNNKLVSVMTFSKGNISKGSKAVEGVWELNRFCSDYNYHIPGIAGKLLEHFKRSYSWKEIFSYADRRWSDGNLYRVLGFNELSCTKPNYWYIKGLQRIHRFNLRKRKDEPNDIPEWALRQKEGYFRVWDCGNFKFNLIK